MRQELVWTTTTTLTYCTVRSSRLAKLNCPKCRAILNIHQPNVDDPHGFLATCGDCGAWFRLQTIAGEVRAVMVSVPEVPPLLSMIEPIPNHSV